MKSFLVKYFTPRNVIIFFVAVFLALYIFREQIKESRLTQAKMEMMKRMTDTPVEEWGGEFKTIYDSLMVQKKDSIEKE